MRRPEYGRASRRGPSPADEPASRGSGRWYHLDRRCRSGRRRRRRSRRRQWWRCRGGARARWRRAGAARRGARSRRWRRADIRCRQGRYAGDDRGDVGGVGEGLRGRLVDRLLVERDAGGREGHPGVADREEALLHRVGLDRRQRDRAEQVLDAVLELGGGQAAQRRHGHLRSHRRIASFTGADLGAAVDAGYCVTFACSAGAALVRRGTIKSSATGAHRRQQTESERERAPGSRSLRCIDLQTAAKTRRQRPCRARPRAVKARGCPCPGREAPQVCL